IPRAGGVEITEDGVAESVNLAKPFEHDFGLQFGAAVGIDGEFGGVFADGNGLRKTKDRAGGGEDKGRDFVAKTGFKKCERGSGIVAEIEGGVWHGLGDFGKCGEVHNRVHGRFGKELVEERAVGDIADHKAGGGRYRRAMAAGEVIENGDLEIILQEEADGSSADVASAAGNEEVLRHAQILVRRWAKCYGLFEKVPQRTNSEVPRGTRRGVRTACSNEQKRIKILFRKGPGIEGLLGVVCTAFSKTRWASFTGKVQWNQ